MITYLFLAVGASGTVLAAHYALRGRGVHRLVIPRSKLRADIARLDTEAGDLACKLIGLASELDGVHDELDATRDERDDATAALDKAVLRIAELEDQLRHFDALCSRNTELRAAVANAYAVRPLPIGDDASALPDHLQEFADATATAWRRASA